VKEDKLELENVEWRASPITITHHYYILWMVLYIYD